jgi:sugar (pentulose or hexulose) kinase
MILSIDMGTTHIKGGVFNSAGVLLQTAKQPTRLHRDASGYSYYDPEEFWAGVIDIISEMLQGVNPRSISAIGISSMAETGVLVDKLTGEIKSQMLPWQDARAAPQIADLIKDRDPLAQFCRSGIRPNFKCGLAKLLWLRDTSPKSLEGSTWLSTADYIAFRMTGLLATDYSLAGRTYAFNIGDLTWDAQWLSNLGLPEDIFPTAYPSTQPVGEIRREVALKLGLHPQISVYICGHDHVCAAFAAAGTSPDKILDSLGTAEALVGSYNKKTLGRKEFESGLVFGRHVVGGGYYWMGGMSASGGSLDWLRGILGEPQLTYGELQQLLEGMPINPTSLLYFPYLAGSGSPHTDIYARGALIGLENSHGRPDILKAILEGTAFEAEFIRQAAEEIMGTEIRALIATGGGSQMPQWMQIKADVCGCEISVPGLSDATLLGAALVAGIGSGLYEDETQALTASQNSTAKNYVPNGNHHLIYRRLYRDGFLMMQEPIRKISQDLHSGVTAASAE